MNLWASAKLERKSENNCRQIEDLRLARRLLPRAKRKLDKWLKKNSRFSLADYDLHSCYNYEPRIGCDVFTVYAYIIVERDLSPPLALCAKAHRFLDGDYSSDSIMLTDLNYKGLPNYRNFKTVHRLSDIARY